MNLFLSKLTTSEVWPLDLKIDPNHNYLIKNSTNVKQKIKKKQINRTQYRLQS